MPMCSISPATLNDVPELLPLVNSAYRGEASRKGWTTEADLLAGDLRTDSENLTGLLKQESSAILLYRDDAGTLAGCVYLDKRDDRLYLGMLSVLPERQAEGIGKQLLNAAEGHAKSVGCHSIFMRVLSARHELIGWYERQGYHKTGKIEPYDAPAKFGTPMRFLEFEVLEKRI